MRLGKTLSAARLLGGLSHAAHLKTPQQVADFALGNEIIEPLQVRTELHAFASLIAERRPKTVLEIGTCRGGTLFVLSRLSHAEATIVSIDLPNGEFGGGYKWFRLPFFKAFAGRSQKISLLRADSHDPANVERVRRILDGRNLDLLFIDGDHTYAGVKADFEMYSPLVKHGIIALHDIARHPASSGAEVSVFWEEIKSNFASSEIIDDPSQGWAGIGILYVGTNS